MRATATIQMPIFERTALKDTDPISALPNTHENLSYEHPNDLELIQEIDQWFVDWNDELAAEFNLDISIWH